jgi:hypothetical protein
MWWQNHTGSFEEDYAGKSPEEDFDIEIYWAKRSGQRI